MSIDRFPMMLFVTKATPFITNDSVHVEPSQMLGKYHYNLFNYSNNIHIISKGFIHVNSLEVDTQTHMLQTAISTNHATTSFSCLVNE